MNNAYLTSKIANMLLCITNLFRESNMAAEVLLEIVYLKDCSFNSDMPNSNFTYIQFYVKLLNNKFD